MYEGGECVCLLCGGGGAVFKSRVHVAVLLVCAHQELCFSFGVLIILVQETTQRHLAKYSLPW